MGILGGSAAVISGGDMDDAVQSKVDGLINQFEEFVSELAKEKGLRTAVVRSRLPCNSVILLDSSYIWIVAERAHGIPSVYHFDRPTMTLDAGEARAVGLWEFGFQDPFAIGMIRKWVDLPLEKRALAVRQAAANWVESEERRVVAMTQLVRLDPIFGPPAFLPEPRLCFVIMPFNDELTEIFERIVKPTVELHDLVCIRADNVRTNRAIIHNIWKSICEARLIIADLTLGNANVFYELGIAHTVGKETILISQREERRRPFDVLHLRTIIYDNTAIGGDNLRRELSASISEALRPAIVEPES
jgi:hypothetical protein